MTSTPPARPAPPRFNTAFYGALILYTVLTLLLSVAAAYKSQHSIDIKNLFDIPFAVGPCAQSILLHHDLSFTMLPPGHASPLMTLHAARMPIASLYVALCALLLGPSHVLQAALLKTILLLLPVYAVAGYFFFLFRNRTSHLLAAFALLIAPFFIPTFLSDVTNLAVEEGFSYCFLIVVFMLVARARPWSGTELWVNTLAVAISLDLLFLVKSSMVVAAAVLTLGFLYRVRSAAASAVLIVLVAAAPLGWGTYQHHVSGRFSLGTSFDGANLHKGNNPIFLEYYPPRPMQNLDNNDDELMQGQTFFTEWQYNDWNQRAAVAYIRTHPAITLRGILTKFYVMFIVLRPYGNGVSSIAPIISFTGMLIFRVLFWTASALALWSILKRRPQATRLGVLYLATVAACALPYMAGFGYTRHASVLIYPSAITICLYLYLTTSSRDESTI